MRDAVVRQGGERYKVVARMHALLEDFDHRFGTLIDDLPPQKQSAFRGLLGTPELLSLMTEHTQMTVLLGDAFERDPGEVRDALADLNLEVARRNADEADDWKKTVDADPDLRRDYDAAAQDYHRDTGYDAYQPSTVVNVSVNPYPYWFGYPWWYPVSYTYYDPWYWWYPRRAWGNCGYGFGPRVAFFGGGPFWRPYYPSYGFTSWYFSYGHHHDRYPYLSDRYVSYYQRPVVVNNYYHYNVRRRTVNKFVHETNHVMPAGYFGGKNRKDRVERFREYGKLAPQIEKVRGETRRKEFEKERGKRPGHDFTIQETGREDRASREEVKKLVAKNPKQFPELAKVKKEDWDRPVERDRDRGKGGKGSGSGVSHEDAGKRDKAAPSLGGPTGGDKGKGKGSDPGMGKERAARPSTEPGGEGQGDGQGKGKHPTATPARRARPSSARRREGEGQRWRRRS